MVTGLTSVSSSTQIRRNTRVANGFSVTGAAYFIVNNNYGAYQGKAPHTVNFTPRNTSLYTYYVTYWGNLVSPDQTTVTQYFRNSQYSNSSGHYYYPTMNIPISY